MGKLGSRYLDSKFYELLKIIGPIFITNIVFIVMNSPLFIGIAILDLKIENSLVLAILSLTWTPSFTALMTCMNRVVEQKEYQGAVAFLKAYRANFKVSLMFGLVSTAIIYILGVDILYFLNQGDVMVGIAFAILLSIFMVYYHNCVSVISRFDIAFKQLLRAGVVMFIVDLKRTFFIIGIIAIPIALVVVLPTESILVVFGIYAYFLAKNYLPLYEALKMMEESNHETNH